MNPGSAAVIGAGLAGIASARPPGDVPDAGFTDDAVLPWFARDGSKPGRDALDTWCLDARAEAAFLSGDAIGMALSETRYSDSSGKMRDRQ
jgi:predicted NAD/FAD-dependent oxidoreductase